MHAQKHYRCVTDAMGDSMKSDCASGPLQGWGTAQAAGRQGHRLTRSEEVQHQQAPHAKQLELAAE